MAKNTIRETIIAGLLVNGGTVIETRSRKFTAVQFLHPPMIYWIGKGGAFRSGRTAGESQVVTASFRARMINAGREFLAKNPPARAPATPKTGDAA